MNIGVSALLSTLAIPAVTRAAAKLGDVLETSFAMLLGQHQPLAGAQSTSSGLDQAAGQSLSESLKSFHQRLAQLLQSAGIDSTVPIHIGWHPDQRLTVRSAHPQWQQLETLVASDVLLATSFRNVAYLRGVAVPLPADGWSGYDPGAVGNLELIWSESGMTLRG